MRWARTRPVLRQRGIDSSDAIVPAQRARAVVRVSHAGSTQRGSELTSFSHFEIRRLRSALAPYLA